MNLPKSVTSPRLRARYPSSQSVHEISDEDDRGDPRLPVIDDRQSRIHSGQGLMKRDDEDGHQADANHA